MTNQGKNAVDLLLAESFKELAQTRPIEKITIKEITDKAGVIRPTFYNHFQDKYELLEWIVINNLMEPVLPLLNNGMMKEGVTFVLTAMAKEKDFYCKAANLEGQNSFEEIFQSCTARILSEHLELQQGKEVNIWLTNTRLIDYYAHSLCYFILMWVRGGMKDSVTDVTEAIITVVMESPFELIHKFKS